MDDYQRYRREQEEAVSNQSGSSAGDVLFTIIPNVCSTLLALTFVNFLGPQTPREVRIVIEFCTTIVPCVLCCTILSDKVIAISQLFLMMSAANIVLILAFKQRDTFSSIVTSTAKKLPFLTSFRALTNIITAVCILAVDFPCFPRKFVKTETYGYSLMDTGVGLFIVANGLVSPEARQVDNSANTSFVDRIRKIVKDCIPLLALGFARSISVEVFGYQKHVSEYGVHWNFFLTLASVRLFTGILSKSLGSKYSFLTGLWILIMHEYTLSTKGLKEWVLSDDPRDDLLSANREGWVSIPGYVGLYLLSVAIGRLIHSTYSQSDKEFVCNVKISTYEFRVGYTASMALILKLYAVANFAFLATYYCEENYRISRRLANSGYCAWILTLSTLVLTFLLMIDIILECVTGCVRERGRRNKLGKSLRRDDLNAKENVQIIKSLEIFEAVNSNGLAFFLMANLFTGAINISIKTLRTDESRAIAIITTYMVVNISFVLLRMQTKRILEKKKSN